MTQIASPEHRDSTITGGFVGPSGNMTVSSPVRTLGQNRWHSCVQSFGRHLALSTMAILIVLVNLFGFVLSLHLWYLVLWLGNIIKGHVGKPFLGSAQSYS